MSTTHLAWVEHQSRRWLRSDAHLWVRHDAHRFAPPGALDREARAAKAQAAARREVEAAAAAEQEAFEQEVLELRWQFKKLKLEYELRRLQQKYSPDQPRDELGQWTGGGGGAFSGGQGNSEDGSFASGQNAQVAELGSPDATLTDASSAPFDPNKPGWHDYTVGPNLVCRAELQCSREEIADQLARFSVPGRDASSPVIDGDISLVKDPRSGVPGGWITTMVEDDGLTIINSTSPAHALYDGVIVRSATQADDGAWHVTTHGFGNNIVPGMNIINQEEGPLIFDVLDQRMRENIERHHAKGYSTLAIRRLVRSGDDGRRPLLGGPCRVR